MMRMIKLIKLIKLFSGLLFCTPGICQTAHRSSENAYITAGAYSMHFMDAFSFTSNPACLADMKVFLSGILAERKWMLAALDSYALASSCTMGKGGMGILLQRSGDADYSEQTGELAYGKNLGRLEMGIRFGYLQISATGYPVPGFGYAGIGIRVHVSENLVTGWELDLPVFGKAGKTIPEKGPQSFRIGFGYEWGTDLFLALQVIKASGIPLNVITSIEYRYGEQFFFSFGINSNTGSPVFQSGWEKNQLCIQLYTAYEPVMGFSPGLILLWKGKNKKG
jgi:hypothetical protein